MKIIAFLLAGLLLAVPACFSQEKTDSPGSSNRLKLGFSVGAVVNKTFSDLPLARDADKAYQRVSDKYVPGFNFNVDLAGRNHKRIMPVGGLGYILSQHEYNVVTYQSQHSIYVNSNSTTVVKDHVISHYLNLYAGLAVRATANLWMEGIVMLTDNFQSKTQSSGFNTTTTTAPATGPVTGTNTPVFETTTTSTNYPVANTISHDPALALSAGIKLHYDFKLCGLPMGCYIGGTGCFTRQLTWYYLGIQVYPFRKLR